MLPMILGFLGSAFAPAIAGATGIAALASPLLAGAVGQGLGTAIQEKDLGAGLKAGLGSFVGGKLLGGLMGSTAGSAATAGMAPGAASGAGGTVKSLLPQLQAQQAAPKGIAGLFGQGAMGQGIRGGMDFMRSAEGIGSQIGGALAAPKPTIKLPEARTPTIDPTKEMRPIPRVPMTPPLGYRPGFDPEFNYGISRPFSSEEILAYRDRGVLPYAEGGEIEMDEDTGEFKVESERPVKANEKTEIVDAIAAIKGQHPQPELALGKFLAKYGEDALRDLVDSVQSGEFDDTRKRFADGENGMVRGPGDGSGVDDKVPATIDGEQDVLLADGEFVLRKDATDALEKKFGGGFLSAVNGAGKNAPKVLKERAA
jgi:hypothetical protein